MYSKFVAVLINSVFGVCFAYTVVVVWGSLVSKFVIDVNFVVGFSLYNIVWLVLDIAYNVTRCKKQGNDLFLWMTIIVPPVLISLILVGAIKIFF